MPVTQAPKWKPMAGIGLERLFEAPIIQAPKRNPKRHKDMGIRPVFSRPILSAGPRARHVTALQRAHTHFHDGADRVEENSGFYDFSSELSRFACDATEHLTGLRMWLATITGIEHFNLGRWCHHLAPREIAGDE